MYIFFLLLLFGGSAEANSVLHGLRSGLVVRINRSEVGLGFPSSFALESIDCNSKFLNFTATNLKHPSIGKIV